MKFSCLIFFFVSLFAVSSLQAAPEKGAITANGKETEKAEKQKGEDEKKKIGVDQSDFMPSANNFGFIVTYAANYNDLEQVDDQTVNHRVSFAGTYSFDQHWSAYGAVSASHQSYGSNIVRENDTDQFHNISNFNVGAVFTKMKPLSFVHRSSNTLNIGLPVSERARVDKHVANLSLTNFMQSYTWRGFSLFNRLTANYLWQTQRFSLFNNSQLGLVGDQLNRDWLMSDSFGVTYMITPRVGARWNFRVDMVRFLDDSWDMSFGDNVSIFANVWGAQLFASMINNSYQENERIDLGYYDRYRRIFLGGVTYAF